MTDQQPVVLSTEPGYVPYYPWSNGDHLYAGALNAAIANARYGTDFVYVRDFGAIGDGVTDDTTALQTAVNSVASSGGQVLIGHLRLYINGSVTVPMNVRLSGEFRHAALNPSQDWYQCGSQIKLGPSGLITVSINEIDHILFIRAGLYAALPTNATDAAAIVANFNGTGLYLPNSPDCLIHECMFLGFATGINAPNCSRLSLIDCRFDCTNGVYAGLSSDVSRFERCHFWPFMTMLISGVGNTPLAYHPIQRSGTALHIDGLEVWAQVISCFQFGYAIGFWVNNASNCVFVACHNDYTNPADNSVAGFNFTGQFNYAKVIGTLCVSVNVGIAVNASGGTLNPIVEVIGGSFITHAHCIDVVSGAALVHGAHFEIGTAAVYYGAGTTNGAVIGCNFNGVTTGVGFANSTVQALVAVLGNIATDGTPTTAEQTQVSLTVPQMNVTGPSSFLAIRNTGAAADQKQWDAFADASGALAFRLLNDAGSAANNWLSVSRSGYSSQNIVLSAQSIELVGGAVGFYGTTPIAKQTLVGAKGGNTALASVITALVSLGLVSDATSA